MSDRSNNQRRGSIRSLVLGPSLGALAFVGGGVTVSAQDEAVVKACAAVLALRDIPRIEQLITEHAASSPCIPLLLAALPARDLARISPEVIALLPPAQLRRMPSTVLEQLGLDGSLGNTRSVSVPSNSNQY